MKITVVGTGYVGLIAGICFADFGNEVLCLDIDEEKIVALNNGQCPIYEPGAEALLVRNIKNKRIKFTKDTKLAMEYPDVIFIAVGTPPTSDGSADIQFVYEVAKDIGKYITKYVVVVDKSTVPVGTAQQVKKIIQQQLENRNVEFDFDVVSNPEFLREGKAVGDFLNPDRVVIGADSQKAIDVMLELYKVFKRSNKPITVTNPETAEVIKYASNAFLSTKIAFINEMAELCEQVGANVLEVAKAMGQDGRISPKFLHPGPGYGGSCFPKDTRAIAQIGRENNVTLSIVESVIKSNEEQKRRSARKVMNVLGEGRVAILGTAFKPDTDDIRESPAITIINELLKAEKYFLQIYDPQALDNVKNILGNNDQVKFCENVYEAIADCDAVLIVTEWLEFRSLELKKVSELMNGNLFYDFRNIYSREDVEKHGLKYYGTGV